LKVNNGAFSLFAGLESEKEAVFGVSHQRGNLNVQDIKIYGTLEHEENLILGADWRPQLVDDLQYGLNSISSVILRNLVHEV